MARWTTEVRKLAQGLCLAGLAAACGESTPGGRDQLDAGNRPSADAAARDAAPDASAPADARTPPVPDADMLEDDAGSEPDAGRATDRDAATESPRTERVPLVDHMRWQLAAHDEWDDRPSDALACTEVEVGFGYGYELFVGEEAFFINTLACDYLSATQPALSFVTKGELIKLRLWHFELTAPEGAEAHVAVSLGEHTLLEDHIPIPSGSELLSVRFVAPEDIPEGTPVTLHLHNHGANEYLLIELSAGPPE